VATKGVLVMAYGTAMGLDDVERYYTDIRRGRPPTPELLEELTDRYRAIGGSPLYETTVAQARGLQERLGFPVYVGQKHSPPFIADGVKAMNDDLVETAVGLVLAPHFSRLSIGDYDSRVRRAAGEIGWDGGFEMIDSWHLEPGFITWTAQRVKAAIEELGVEDPLVVFSAHSLPEKILASGDPYAEQLRETAAAVAREGGITNWRTGWQSAGRTADPWLGPDVLEILEEVDEAGIVVCPCGFVADHLEVLYDLDIEARRKAEELGLPFTRTAMPNADPDFLDVLARVVSNAFDA
jgi:protoporphyrin/coproporphyrin ferrochelatase